MIVIKKIYILSILNILTIFLTKEVFYIFLINLSYIPFLYDDFFININKYSLLKVKSFKKVIISYFNHFKLTAIELEIVFENYLGFSILNIFIKNLLKNTIKNYSFSIVFLSIALFLIFWANRNIKKFFTTK
ncbi:hypothetical protein GCM10008914_28870 [Clostridium tertium]